MHAGHGTSASQTGPWVNNTEIKIIIEMRMSRKLDECTSIIVKYAQHEYVKHGCQSSKFVCHCSRLGEEWELGIQYHLITIPCSKLQKWAGHFIF